MRPVKTSGPDEPLVHRLGRAEKYFNLVGRHCNIRIVGRTYGLILDNPSLSFERTPVTPGLLPEGYLLGAKVITIEPEGDGRLPPEQERTYRLGVKRYFEEISAHDPRLSFKDIIVQSNADHPPQVVYGSPFENGEPPAAWFVDIDPLVGTEEFPLTVPPNSLFHNVVFVTGAGPPQSVIDAL